MSEEATREDDDRRQYEEDLKSLMQQEAFRRFAWSLLSDCQMYRSSMTGNAWTQFAEGMRNVGIKLTRDMITNRENYMKMWSENALASDFTALTANGKEENFEDV